MSDEIDTRHGSIAQLIAQARAAAFEWHPIESAPKGKKLIVGYYNSAGHWRTITARYYLPKTLETSDESDTEEEFAPEGWYEESETHENILPTDCTPTHWMPLPEPPTSGRPG